MVSRLKPSRRLANALAAGLCFAAIAYAVGWLQLVGGFAPCPLCVVDRAAFALAGLVFLIAALHDPQRTGRRVYALAALAAVAVGLVSAGRHVWLQHLPAEQVPACGPSLGYLVTNFPLSETVDLVLRGSGSCAEIQWQFLGLSIPEWTLGLFVVLALFALATVVHPGRQ